MDAKIENCSTVCEKCGQPKWGTIGKLEPMELLTAHGPYDRAYWVRKVAADAFMAMQTQPIDWTKRCIRNATKMAALAGVALADAVEAAEAARDPK